MAVFRVGLLSRVQGLKQLPGMMVPERKPEPGFEPGPELQVSARKPEPELVSELGLVPEPGLALELPWQGRSSGSKVSSE